VLIAEHCLLILKLARPCEQKNLQNRLDCHDDRCVRPAWGRIPSTSRQLLAADLDSKLFPINTANRGSISRRNKLEIAHGVIALAGVPHPVRLIQVNLDREAARFVVSFPNSLYLLSKALSECVDSDLCSGSPSLLFPACRVPLSSTK
jgi:hypothetical protein